MTRSVCRYCGEKVVVNGTFSMRNHERNCALSTFDRDSDDDVLFEPLEPATPLDLEAIDDPRLDVVCADEDYDHLHQFMSLGRCHCSEAELQLVKFVNMAQEGYGVSRQFSRTMLNYAKASGGLNNHLPDTWTRCVHIATDLVEELTGKRKTFTLDIPIPDSVRELLADPRQTHIAFEFECPITEMIRVAMFSRTCQDLDNVAFSYEENDGYLDDFCNGDRYKRIAATINRGSAILGAVLATDGICLDKCMFDSQEVDTPLPNLTAQRGGGVNLDLNLDWTSCNLDYNPD